MNSLFPIAMLTPLLLRAWPVPPSLVNADDLEESGQRKIWHLSGHPKPAVERSWAKGHIEH
jgi:hypothetical protein